MATRRLWPLQAFTHVGATVAVIATLSSVSDAVSPAPPTISTAPSERAEGAPGGLVSLVRLPGGGLQPQVAIDAAGRAHVVYFKGSAEAGDLFYTLVGPDGQFAPSIRVNSQSGSAMAVGNMRGGHLALGRNGLVHVAWFGSNSAKPRAPGGTTPILYSRSNGAGTPFEPERNVVQYAVNLDGGSVAADPEGHVFVAWHGAGPAAKSEAEGQLWVARSTDDGVTFGKEQAVSAPELGACGCCGVGALAGQRGAYFLFRSARDIVHRDTYLVSAPAGSDAFTSTKLEEWNLSACPMSTFALAESPKGVIAAWETAGRVQFTRLDPVSRLPTGIIAAAAGAGGQKYPAVAVNQNGDVLLAWTEGMAWQRGGDFAWQVFDRDGKPTSEHGRRSGVPTWSLVAVYAMPDGTFRILY